MQTFWKSPCPSTKSDFIIPNEVPFFVQCLKCYETESAIFTVLECARYAFISQTKQFKLNSCRIPVVNCGTNWAALISTQTTSLFFGAAEALNLTPRTSLTKILYLRFRRTTAKACHRWLKISPSWTSKTATRWSRLVQSCPGLTSKPRRWCRMRKSCCSRSAPRCTELRKWPPRRAQLAQRSPPASSTSRCNDRTPKRRRRKGSGPERSSAGLPAVADLPQPTNREELSSGDIATM